jgi:hypothetical protein
MFPCSSSLPANQCFHFRHRILTEMTESYCCLPHKLLDFVHYHSVVTLHMFSQFEQFWRSPEPYIRIGTSIYLTRLTSLYGYLLE